MQTRHVCVWQMEEIKEKESQQSELISELQSTLQNTEEKVCCVFLYSLG